MTIEKCSNNIEPDKLGNLLKSSMSNMSLSMRQLSQKSGISVATISRIISGKHAVSVNHLQKLSKHLNTPIEALLDAMGVSQTKQQSYKLSTIWDDIISDLDIDRDTIVNDINNELKKLEQYAKTLDGQKRIINHFHSKIDAIDSAGIYIDKMHSLYSLFTSPKISPQKKAVVGSALLYFVSAVEVIPDYLFPLGYLDDVIAIKLVEKKLLDMEETDGFNSNQ